MRIPDDIVAACRGYAPQDGVEGAALCTVIKVETGGRPFEAADLDPSDGIEPAMLFERHIFMKRLAALAPKLVPEAKLLLASMDAAIARAPVAPVAPEDRAGGLHDQAREAAFRARPGDFLDGATPSMVRPLLPGFGFVSLDGRDLPWTYAAEAYAESDLRELLSYMREGSHRFGLLAGAPGTDDCLPLPENVLFVSVVVAGGRSA